MPHVSDSIPTSQRERAADLATQEEALRRRASRGPEEVRDYWERRANPGYGTRRGGRAPVERGIADPAWTRLALATIVPILLAITVSLPMGVRVGVISLLIVFIAQGWPGLLRARHDNGSSIVIALAGLSATGVVAWRGDYGAAAIVMALSVLVAFVAQMLRRDGREGLVEDIASTVTGSLVVVSGSAWCAMQSNIAAQSVIVPCCLALIIGALLTTLRVRASVLEGLTVSLPALAAGVAGWLLATIGFFGPTHMNVTAAMQSAGASLICGFVAGVLMAASNRILWTHRWVPGGRAAVASAIVPVLAVGAPVYAIARLMAGFIAG